MKNIDTITAKNLIEADISKLEQQIKKEKLTKYKAKDTKSVLADLLKNVGKVDFHEKAYKDSNRYISQSEYVVLIVEELNEIIEKTSFGLRSFGGILYLFNGAYWSELTTEDLENFLTDIAIQMGVPEVKAKHNKFTKDLFLQFLKRAATPTIGNNTQTLVNLLNGTFEITADTQVLREPRKDDFLKYQLPFVYDINAKSPIFDKFLDRVLPDKTLQYVLMEFLGYVFIKEFSLQKALLLKGGGANGKSVFYDVVCSLLGSDNVSTFSIQSLTQQNSYTLPCLDNRLLNYSSEIGKILDIEKFKQLVSNEKVDARRIYGEPFEFKNYAKLIFNCNELPNNTEQTDAYFRRFMIVPFEQTIPKEEQDVLLASKIISAELSGIFNRVLKGLQSVLTNKRFTYCKAIDDQVERYRRESDSVSLFIEEKRYTRVADSYTILSDLYSDYRAFCTTNGYFAVSNIKMSRRLESLGYEKNRLSCGMVFNIDKSNSHE